MFVSGKASVSSYEERVGSRLSGVCGVWGWCGEMILYTELSGRCIDGSFLKKDRAF